MPAHSRSFGAASFPFWAVFSWWFCLPLSPLFSQVFSVFLAVFFFLFQRCAQIPGADGAAVVLRCCSAAPQAVCAPPLFPLQTAAQMPLFFSAACVVPKKSERGALLALVYAELDQSCLNVLVYNDDFPW